MRPRKFSMPRSIGDQFLHVAMGPLAMAGASFRRGDVTQGLAELSGESLVGSVQRAVDAVARTVGLPRTEVERLLPAGEMDALVGRIAPAQVAATSQWERHMSQASSLLEAIAKLTADGRAPEAGLCLMRIATKMRLERELAAPLRELAERIDEWQLILERVGKRIDAGKELEKARLRRERQRITAAVTAITALLGGAGLAGWVVRLRNDVDQVLVRSNACEAELLTERHLKVASSFQREAVAGRLRACASMRVEAKRQEERRRAEQEASAREEALRRERKTMCAELAERLGTPRETALAPRTLELLGRDAPLFMRLAKGKLDAEDVRREVESLACLDGSGTAVARAYAVALVTSAESWVPTTLPSKSAAVLATRGKEALSLSARDEFARVVDKRALQAIMSGKLGIIEEAVRACEVLGTLDATPRIYCRALLKRYRP